MKNMKELFKKTTNIFSNYKNNPKLYLTHYEGCESKDQIYNIYNFISEIEFCI